MSAIKLSCKNCDNVGYPSEDGNKTGFKMDVMTMTLVNMQSYGDGNTADIVGNEMIENPVERVTQAAPKGGLVCDICGSTEVEVTFEVDMIQERREDIVVEQIDGELLGDLMELEENVFHETPMQLDQDVDDIDLSNISSLQLDESMFESEGDST